VSRVSKRKIILFHPRTFHERNYRYYHIPYSLLAIAAPLDLRKFDVVIMDNNVNKKQNYGDVISQIKNEIVCVGISCMIGLQIKDALKFAKVVREKDPKILIIFGGPLPTMLPEETTAHELVDVAVRGQGEITFSELVRCIKQNISWNAVPGISYKINGKVVHNPDRPFCDLNKFPSYQKVYSLINIKNYIRADEHIAPRTLSYHSSQGCPYECGFCCEVPLWKRWYSGLSPERMLNDIQYLVERDKINGIKFYDSEFFINLGRSLKFARGLLDKNIEIKWGASIHPKNLYRIKDGQLKLLAESGLRRLLVGVESGVQEELDLVKKKIATDTVFEVAEKCHSHRIIGCFTFITGYPSMPDKNVDKTISFAHKLTKSFPEHEVKLHLYAPYPGTPIYSLAMEYGFNPPQSLEEWASYDYYEVTTPWAKPEWEKKIRELNESYYPYIHQNIH